MDSAKAVEKAYMTRIFAFLFLLSSALSFAGLSARAQQPRPSPSPQTARHTPQARTQAEYADYNAANAISTGAAMEKAANDFAAKYPDSELRSFLYSKAMHNYQAENNPDRVNKTAEIQKNAGRVLQTIDSAFVPPPGATADQIKGYKDTLRSMAHSAIGIMSLKDKDDARAEAELKLSADLLSAPDPYVWYHLALAQDHQGKYAEALSSVQKALNYASANPELGKLASGERDRLILLTHQETPSGQQAPGNSSQPPH